MAQSKDTPLLSYRKAGLSDLAQLQALGQQSYGEFSEVLTPEYWDTMNGHLENDAALTQLIQQSEVFVCETPDGIVGMIYWVPAGNPTELFKENWSYIRFLGVHTTYRGHGIGKKLTDLCIDQAHAAGEKYIALHTSEFMEAARAIYEKKGFKKTREITYLGKRYWIYLLEL